MAKTAEVSAGDNATATQYNNLRDDMRLPNEAINVNLIKNYPSLEGADGAQPEWWEASNATVTEEDATGESLSSPPNERVLKVVSSSNPGIIYQSFTGSNEELLVPTNSIVSFGAWVYLVDSATLSLYLGDASAGVLSSISTTTTSSWVWLEVTGVTIGADVLSASISVNASSKTFYIANPVMNVGPSTMPWRPRGLKYKSNGIMSQVLNVNPSDTAWHDLDLSSASNNNAVIAELNGGVGGGAQGDYGYLRRNGSSVGQVESTIFNTRAFTSGSVNTILILLDDGQIIEYSVNDSAGISAYQLMLEGYYYWE